MSDTDPGPVPFPPPNPFGVGVVPLGFDWAVMSDEEGTRFGVLVVHSPMGQLYLRLDPAFVHHKFLPLVQALDESLSKPAVIRPQLVIPGR